MQVPRTSPASAVRDRPARPAHPEPPYDEDHMTATLDRTAPSDSSTRPDHRPDHRPGTHVRAMALIAGGVLFAVGNALHPLRHDAAALEAPTWLASHLVFGVGSLLMAAGLGALTQRMAPSRVATVSSDRLTRSRRTTRTT